MIKKNDFKVLMYHYIDDNIEHPMCVSKSKFCEQLSFLIEEGYQFLSLDDVKKNIYNGKSLGKSVLITFDDGYKNTFSEVLPIIKKYKAKATVSICSSYINEKTLVKPTIHLCQEFGNVNDINSWIEEGNDVAAHTYSHKKLSHLSEEEIIYEVELDNTILVNNFGNKIDCFFYPFGSVNKMAENIVAQKYKLAFVTNEGKLPSYEDRYNIGRIYVDPKWDIEKFSKVLEN